MKELLLILGLTLGIAGPIAAIVVIRIERNRPETATAKQARLERERIAAKAAEEAAVQAEREQQEAAAQAEREQKAEAKRQADLAEAARAAEEAKAKKRVEDELDKKYRSVAKSHGEHALMMYNLYLEGTSLQQWREENKKLKVLSAKLADPMTANNKLFHQQAKVIQSGIDTIADIWSLAIEGGGDWQKTLNKLVTKEDIATGKELSKKLLISIEQYNDK
jgi:hypothetical protein